MVFGFQVDMESIGIAADRQEIRVGRRWSIRTTDRARRMPGSGFERRKTVKPG